ncbi:uncharacterized protein LOC131204984 [Ahaetulla prasina]|uniref:uncharacterized protein LOC131204984 n=1 Tax=Ahaetulla prasina TaxID=499056 RepID=UPI00264A1A58|nr:uncharacterized protein LOC131204984 [Ahaetulla prasina]
MVPKEGIQYPAIVQLLLHFRWTLIGLFASDTEKGEHFMRTFTPKLVRSGICVVISLQFSKIEHAASLREALFKWRQVNVFVHFIEVDSISDRILPFHETFLHLPGPIEGKVWILTNFAGYEIKKHRLFKYIHSIWNFVYLAKERPRDDALEPHFFVEENFQDPYFRCSLSQNVFSVKGRRRCTQEAPLETQEKRNRKRITNYFKCYSIIKTLTHVLNAAYSSRSRRGRKEGEKRLGSPRLQPWQSLPQSRCGNVTLDLSRRLEKESQFAAAFLVRRGPSPLRKWERHGRFLPAGLLVRIGSQKSPQSSSWQIGGKGELSTGSKKGQQQRPNEALQGRRPQPEDLKLGTTGVAFALLHFGTLRVSGQLPSPTPEMLLGVLSMWLLSSLISLCHDYFHDPLYPKVSNGTLYHYFMPANSEELLGKLEN